MIVFGGLEGIDGVVENMETNETMNVSKLEGLFDENVTCINEQGSRQVRTEEQILISLGQVLPMLRQFGAKNQKKVFQILK